LSGQSELISEQPVTLAAMRGNMQEHLIIWAFVGGTLLLSWIVFFVIGFATGLRVADKVHRDYQER
jgi:hypothetical protein